MAATASTAGLEEKGGAAGSAPLPPEALNGTWPLAHSVGAYYNLTQQHALGIINEHATTARVLWVGADGSEVSYGVVMPGMRSVFYTYVGHHWRVRDLATNELWYTPHSQSPGHACGYMCHL